MDDAYLLKEIGFNSTIEKLFYLFHDVIDYELDYYSGRPEQEKRKQAQERLMQVQLALEAQGVIL